MKRYFVVTVENDTILIDGKEQPCSVEHLQAALDYWGTGHKAVEIDEAAYRASLINGSMKLSASGDRVSAAEPSDLAALVKGEIC
jgi:hypothetical protein